VKQHILNKRLPQEVLKATVTRRPRRHTTTKHQQPVRRERKETKRTQQKSYWH